MKLNLKLAVLILAAAGTADARWSSSQLSGANAVLAGTGITITESGLTIDGEALPGDLIVDLGGAPSLHDARGADRGSLWDFRLPTGNLVALGRLLAGSGITLSREGEALVAHVDLSTNLTINVVALGPGESATVTIRNTESTPMLSEILASPISMTTSDLRDALRSFYGL